MLTLSTLLGLALATASGPEALLGEPAGKRGGDDPAPGAGPAPVDLEASGDLFQLGAARGKVHLIVAKGDELRLHLKDGGRFGEPKVIHPLGKARKKTEEREWTIRSLALKYGPEGDLHIFLESGEQETGRIEVRYGRFASDGKPRHTWLTITDTGSPRDSHRFLGAFWKGKDVLCVATSARMEVKTGPNSTSTSNSRVLLGLVQGGKYKVLRASRDTYFGPGGGVAFGTSERDAQAIFVDGQQLSWSSLERYQPRLATSVFPDAYLSSFSAFQSKDGLIYAAVQTTQEKKVLEPRVWLGSGKLGKTIEPLNISGILEAAFRPPVRWSFAESPDGKVYFFAGVSSGQEITKKALEEIKDEAKLKELIAIRLAWWDLSGSSPPEAKIIPGIEVMNLQQVQGALEDPKKAVIVWKEDGIIRSRSFGIE